MGEICVSLLTLVDQLKERMDMDIEEVEAGVETTGEAGAVTGAGVGEGEAGAEIRAGRGDAGVPVGTGETEVAVETGATVLGRDEESAVIPGVVVETVETRADLKTKITVQHLRAEADPAEWTWKPCLILHFNFT